MADSYVCSGAMMKCTMGTSPATLTVLPNRTVYLAGQLMANISDHQSMVNLAPFGLCRSLGFPPTASATAAAMGTLTPMPCMHNTPAPWMVGKTDYLIKGQPALLKSCTCQCMWGGTISLINNGQVGEGAQGVNESKHPWSPLGDFGIEVPSSPIQATEASPKQTGEADSLDVVKMKPWLKSLTDQQKADVRNLMGLVQEGSDLDKLVKVYEMMQVAPRNMSFQDKTKFAENYIELEKKLNFKKGKKMSVQNADKQNANPKYAKEYIPDPKGNYVKKSTGERFRKNPDYDVQYTINCATCAAAYALRLLGFDVKAKGNPKQDGNRNTWLSKSHSFDIWNNPDGTPASPSHYSDWMQKKGIETMSAADYKSFFEEECKEQGVYIVTVTWVGNGGGHATVLHRDADGKLYYIEPQVFDSNKTTDGRRSIDDLVNRMAPKQPSQKGVMRVDNKIFNVDYADLFEI